LGEIQQQNTGNLGWKNALLKKRADLSGYYGNLDLYGGYLNDLGNSPDYLLRGRK